jgi:hypothetical protein
MQHPVPYRSERVMRKINPPMFQFAYHDNTYLSRVVEVVKEEPWGRNYKILDLYLKANFEIARNQGKVYENDDRNVAFWRAGKLVNRNYDPVWMLYEKNKDETKQKWYFKGPHAGDSPIDVDLDLELIYDPPPFNPNYRITIHEPAIKHIFEKEVNRERLQAVFGELASNNHLVYRVVIGEIELKRKQSIVLPQWYKGQYQFIMPLNLTNPTQVDLVATLTPNVDKKLYEVNTLLLPHYAYPYVRSLVPSRESFANWMLMSDDDLQSDDEEETAD